MDAISVAAAARALGITDMGVRAAIRRGRIRDASKPGGFALVNFSDVQRFMEERRLVAATRNPDPVAYARAVVDTLNPPTAGYRSYSPRGRDALRLLGDDGPALLGPDVLAAAAHRKRLQQGGGCPTCWARMSASVHMSMAPRNDEATRILLGQPCAKDLAVWQAEADERRAADRRLAQRLAQQERAAAQSTARQEFTSAQKGLQTAAERARTAATRLAAVDPAAAVQAATGDRRTEALTHRSRLPQCACTSETLCREHARRLAPKPARRPGPRR